MTGDISIWAYPWDVHDIGLDTALARLADVGVNMVSLATSYHAGRFLQPGNPKRRVYFPQDGTVYYSVDESRWSGAEIAPLQADIVSSEGDYLAKLVDARDAGGPKVSCWTVCLHNTRLGMLHPDHVMRTAFGDPHWYGLCPSSPAARDYVIRMVSEIADRYAPDRIELESPNFMGFDHGYHHEKDGLGLAPVEAFLLGVCFCNHCMARAGAAGISAEGARRKVAAVLGAAFSRALPEPEFGDFAQSGLAAFDEAEELAAYLRWRSEPVTSLLEEIRAEAAEGTKILLIDFEGSWDGGVEISDAAAACDGILHCAYTTPVERIGPLFARTKAMLGPGKALIAGFQLFHPEVGDADDLTARAAAAKDAATGFNFYNLGLVPDARLDWIAQALS